MTKNAGIVLLFVVSVLAQNYVGEQYEGHPLAIVDVTVIDVLNSIAIPHQSVVVRYGKIDYIKPAAKFETPGWMTELNGRGKFLIPGLWDAHVHLFFWDELDANDTTINHHPDPEAYREPLNRFVAWGVTSVRDMGGDLSAIDRWRDRIEHGKWQTQAIEAIVLRGRLLDAVRISKLRADL
jgi:imidazolonepropionase-like amidohydrolase